MLRLLLVLVALLSYGILEVWINGSFMAGMILGPIFLAACAVFSCIVAKLVLADPRRSEQQRDIEQNGN